jgi:hypothetical protein
MHSIFPPQRSNIDTEYIHLVRVCEMPSEIICGRGPKADERRIESGAVVRSSASGIPHSPITLHHTGETALEKMNRPDNAEGRLKMRKGTRSCTQCTSHRPQNTNSSNSVLQAVGARSAASLHQTTPKRA